MNTDIDGKGMKKVMTPKLKQLLEKLRQSQDNYNAIKEQKSMNRQMMAQEKMMMKMQQGGPVSSQDSLRHQAGKTMDYEFTKGSAYGTGLSNYGNPALGNNPSKEEAVNWYMDNIAPKLSPFSSAMEKGEAGDFMYNSGKDVRPYAIQEYLRKTDPQNKTEWQDNKGNYKYRKDSTKWDNHWNNIQKLPENDRRIYINRGRDFYYQNINKVNGQPNPAYEKTWKPRIWESVNTYENGGKLPKYDVGGLFSGFLNMLNPNWGESGVGSSPETTTSYTEDKSKGKAWNWSFQPHEISADVDVLKWFRNMKEKRNQTALDIPNIPQNTMNTTTPQRTGRLSPDKNPTYYRKGGSLPKYEFGTNTSNFGQYQSNNFGGLNYDTPTSGVGTNYSFDPNTGGYDFSAGNDLSSSYGQYEGYGSGYGNYNTSGGGNGTDYSKYAKYAKYAPGLFNLGKGLFDKKDYGNIQTTNPFENDFLNRIHSSEAGMTESKNLLRASGKYDPRNELNAVEENYKLNKANAQNATGAERLVMNTRAGANRLSGKSKVFTNAQNWEKNRAYQIGLGLNQIDERLASNAERMGNFGAGKLNLMNVKEDRRLATDSAAKNQQMVGLSQMFDAWQLQQQQDEQAKRDAKYYEWLYNAYPKGK